MPDEPTERQLDYLADLGHKGARPKTKEKASELISKLEKKHDDKERKASARQLIKDAKESNKDLMGPSDPFRSIGFMLKQYDDSEPLTGEAAIYAGAFLPLEVASTYPEILTIDGLDAEEVRLEEQPTSGHPCVNGPGSIGRYEKQAVVDLNTPIPKKAKEMKVENSTGCLGVLAIAALIMGGSAVAANDFMAPTTQPTDTAATQPAKAPITYKGRRIANEQAAEWYRKYGKQIAMVDGKAVDVGRWLLDPAFINSRDVPAVGALAYPAGKDGKSGLAKVVEVAADGKSVTVERGPDSLRRPNLVLLKERDVLRFRVNVDGKAPAVGDAWIKPVVYVSGEKKGQVWQEFRQTTEAEFYAVLDKGMELVEYKAVPYTDKELTRENISSDYLGVTGPTLDSILKQMKKDGKKIEAKPIR